MSSVLHGAPDEWALGKDEGYPVCSPGPRTETRFLIGLVSRRDEVAASRRVECGLRVRPLDRGEQPAWRYEWRGEACGLDDYLRRHRTTGFLVLRGDRVLAERYQYDRHARHRMTSMSMAKTVVAMLVGIALEEGAIGSLDDRAQDHVPDLAGSPYGGTRLRHLLSMSSGVRFTESYNGRDDVAMLSRLSLLGGSEGGPATLAPFCEREHPPGERFRYSSAESQALGLVLRAATGMTLAQYLSERIWIPMGAEAHASWLVDRGGYEAAFTGLNATLRDYGRLGLLLADDGAIPGRQVIPAAWVRAATCAKFGESALLGYGYQTWILRGLRRQFVLRGVRGQALFVDPAARIVMVHTAAGEIGTPVGELLALWRSVVACAV